MAFDLTELERIIGERAGAPAASSHTAALLAGGMTRCAKKLGEEAVETVIAAMAGDRTELTKESADLIYHLLVVLKAAQLPLDAVLAELESRTVRSGIAEKAARPRATG